MSNYHDHPAMNWSRLKAAATSAAHLRQVIVDGNKPATAAMELGTAIHLAVLEPERFVASVVTAPEAFVTAGGALSTGKEAKAWRAGIAPDALVLTAQQIATCEAIRENVLAHDDARVWLESADLREHEAFWSESVEAAGVVTQIDCRMKADAICTKLGLLWDLKSIGTSMTDLSVNACVMAIARRAYFGQLGYYTRGLAKNGIDVNAIGWVFVESSAPFDVVVIQADAAMMQAGYDLADKLLKRYAAALVTGRWLGVAQKTVVASLPKWGAVSADDETDSLSTWGI